MRVLIVGCGYIGCRLGAELARSGHSVWGVRRTPQASVHLLRLGITPLIADICRPETFTSIERGYDWVVHCVSSGGGGPEAYERVYFQGTRNLVAWLSADPPVKLVYTSSTSVYGQTDGRWVDETHAAPASPTAEVLSRTEDLLLSAASDKGIPVAILRVAGIYGPGRAHWLNRVRDGTVRFDELDQSFLNMIHLEDVVGAIQAALLQASGAGVYNAVDDEPVTRIALLEWLSMRLGVALPMASSGARVEPTRGLTNKRVSNRRLRTELVYQFRYPTFREGYEQILRAS